MKSELGITCALSTIGPLYHHLKALRAETPYFAAQTLASQVADTDVSLNTLRSATNLLISTRLFKTASDAESSVRDLVSLSHLAFEHGSRNIPRNVIHMRPRGPQLSSPKASSQAPHPEPGGDTK